VVNADTYDPEEATTPPLEGELGRRNGGGQHKKPFDCTHLSLFNFHLQPTNVYPIWGTDRKSRNIFELDEIQCWWKKNCLVSNVTKVPMIEEKLRCDIFKEHDARMVATDVYMEYSEHLHVLRSYGLSFV